MEGRPRRSFTDDYKRQAAELVTSSSRSIGPVANFRELNRSEARMSDNFLK